MVGEWQVPLCLTGSCSQLVFLPLGVCALINQIISVLWWFSNFTSYIEFYDLLHIIQLMILISELVN